MIGIIAETLSLCSCDIHYLASEALFLGKDAEEAKVVDDEVQVLGLVEIIHLQETGHISGTFISRAGRSRRFPGFPKILTVALSKSTYQIGRSRVQLPVGA